jgi:transcriptional regulator with XRE-family HTH domain
MNKPPLVTEAGRKALGELLKQSREAMSWSLDDLAVELRIRTGEKLSKSTLNNMERGINTPAWDTLAILAAVGYVKNPNTGALLTAHEMFDICTETFGSKKARRSAFKEVPRAASPEGNYNAAAELAYC